LSMHTGINTGVVVTGEINLEKGIHGVLGDTINVASRLCSKAKPDEIIIGHETYHEAEGYFHLEEREPAAVKGKAEPIRIYKVLSAREAPSKTHRLSGLRAELIGRRVEMAQLQEALENLKQGNASIFSIVGDAGTGKSRLIEEFKSNLDLNTIQWREGHAYAYSQNIPYFPLIDLLNRAWQVREGDHPDEVRQKVERGAGALIGERKDLIPYVGSLYALPHQEIEQVSPENWKARLYEAIQLIFSNLCRRAPTIVCIEDLHWADASSVELLRNILIDLKYPILFICIYRPTFNLFTSHQISGIKFYHEIRLIDLSSSESQDMVESLLQSKEIPSDLRKFIQDKVEGNPFYLEEAVNSLIEAEILVRDKDTWKLIRPLTEKDIPTTVQGVISARLDRLEKETKHILQEASVIGRAFLYEILHRISELKDYIDKSLTNLERLDLIRTRSLQPDLEYIFKHALTQEVVYNGLLKKERQQIHEKIGFVMEGLFHDRLHEFYETLAYHFREGRSLHKAIEYLMKAGEKSKNRYSLEEANLYYQEAFNLLSSKSDRSMSEQELLIEIINDWSFVQYLRGHFGDLHNLLFQHKNAAELIYDKSKTGIFYYWLGQALFNLEMYVDAYDYLKKSLAIGEELKDQRVVGYALCELIWACAELGRFNEGDLYGERVLELSKKFPSDFIIFAMSRAGLAHLNLFRGTGTPGVEMGRELINKGLTLSDVRTLWVGHLCCGEGYIAKGEFESAIESLKQAIEVSVDPFHRQAASSLLGFVYLEALQVSEAEKVLMEVISFDEKFGSKHTGTPARSFLGAILILKGNLSKGLKMIEEAKDTFIKSERKWAAARSDYNFGVIYSQLAGGGQKPSFSLVAKNIVFLLKNIPFAAKKAEDYFQEAIRQYTELGSKGHLGRAFLDLGRLHKMKGRTDQARKYISDAIKLFDECEAEGFLKQAKEELASL
ncbi:MAG: AAA family ATPase, partial [Methanothrix sp.]|nr:AAA family ATPase [Methanothrix sp.]